MTPPHVVPSTFYGGNNYTEWTSPVAQVPADRSFFFSPDLVDTRGDSLVATVDPPAGTSPFSTNIIAGPELVTIEGGIEWVGRSQTGMAVVRRVEPGDGPIRVVIEAADGPATQFGPWLSLVGLIGVVLVVAVQVFLRWHCRRLALGRGARGGRP